MVGCPGIRRLRKVVTAPRKEAMNDATVCGISLSVSGIIASGMVVPTVRMDFYHFS